MEITLGLAYSFLSIIHLAFCAFLECSFVSDVYSQYKAKTWEELWHDTSVCIVNSHNFINSLFVSFGISERRGYFVREFFVANSVF